MDMNLEGRRGFVIRTAFVIIVGVLVFLAVSNLRKVGELGEQTHKLVGQVAELSKQNKKIGQQTKDLTQQNQNLGQENRRLTRCLAQALSAHTTSDTPIHIEDIDQCILSSQTENREQGNPTNETQSLQPDSTRPSETTISPQQPNNTGTPPSTTPPDEEEPEEPPQSILPFVSEPLVGCVGTVCI